ncbi:MAG: hypothetical protein HQL21_04230, partial [Candidatus Omnitrophica bacterium]|nr:hypothetical protein [Candidatus Omnitrophota bacterium]
SEQDAVRKIWGVLHQGQFIHLKDLENPDTIARLRAEATEIIDLEAELGGTVARRVPTFHADGKAGYEKVSSDGMEGYLKNNGLVINEDGSFGFRPVTDLAKPGAFDPKIGQVLKIGKDGRTAGYMVPIWNNNKSDMHYADKSVVDLDGFLRDNGVVISKDGEHAGFTSVQDPANIDVPRADVKEFLIIGLDGSTTGRMLPMLNGGWVRVNTPEKAMAALGQGILGWLKATLALGILATGLELPLGAAEMPQVAPPPAPIVAPAVPGIADFVKENFLVLTGDPNSFGFVSAKELASPDLRFMARQILVMNPTGEPIESMVPVFGEKGYQRVPNAEMGIVLRSQLPTNDVVRGTQLDPAASGSIFKFIPTKDGTEPKAVVLNPDNDMVKKARAVGHFNEGEVKAVAGKGFTQVWPVLQGISLVPFNKTHAFIVTKAGANLAEYQRSTPKANQDPKKLEALKAAARATPMGFIEVEKLKDPATHEKVRLAADGIEMQDESENVVARIYLDPAFASSRVESIDGTTSRLYELPSYELGGNMAPVEITTYEDVRGEDPYLRETGEFRHVSKTDTRPINSDIKDIKVTDVYAKETIGVREDGKPIFKLTLRYSIRELQQEVIFYAPGDDGRQRESYYISTDLAKDKGFSVVIDGKLKENVVHLTKSASTIDSTSGTKTVVAQGVSLRGLRDNGGYASARIQRYEDDRLKEDVTGFVKLDLAALEAGALSEEAIQDYARDHRILRLDDPYTYNPDGSEKRRDVRLNADQSNDPAKASWTPGWTITPGGTNTQPEMVSKLLKHPRIKKIFDQYGLNATTPWLAGVLTTEQGVVSTTYRIKGDSREKPFITIREEAGHILDYTVGLEFKKETGSPVVAYVLTPALDPKDPNLQISAIRLTVPNNDTVRELIKKYGAEKVYAALMGRHFPNNTESLEQQFSNIGISLDLKPTRVMEIPMIVKTGTQDPRKLDYRTVEPQVRKLVEQYAVTTDPAVQNSLLDQIQQIVRANRSAREISYSSDQGLATDHYLIPNDSRGRDAFQIMPNGNLEVPMWWFEGVPVRITDGPAQIDVKPVVGIMPGVVVIGKDGKYKHTLVYDKTELTPAGDPNDANLQIKANRYRVLDAEFMLGAKLSPGGRVMREHFRHLVHRVAAGKLGVATEGVEEIVYDMFSPFQVPLYGLKTGKDGIKRITQVPEVEAFSSVSTSSRVDKLSDTVSGHDLVSEQRKDPVTDITSLEMEATAPSIYKSKTTRLQDGKPLSKNTEDIWSSWGQDVKDGWGYIVGFLGLLGSVFITGSIFGAIRKRSQKTASRKAVSE